MCSSDLNKEELPKFGRMYEVNIKANPDQFLDWDKALSEQPANSAIQNYAKEIESLGLSNEYKDFLSAAKMTGMPGEWFMRAASGGMKPNLPALSADLKAAGIPGIKYLDQGSRAAGEGSRNYVVFDDKLIDIIRKYGLAAFGMPVLANSFSVGADQK